MGGRRRRHIKNKLYKRRSRKKLSVLVRKQSSRCSFHYFLGWGAGVWLGWVEGGKDNHITFLENLTQTDEGDRFLCWPPGASESVLRHGKL